MVDIVKLLQSRGFGLNIIEPNFAQYSHPTVAYTVNVYSDGVWMDNCNGTGVGVDSIAEVLKRLP